MASVSRVSCSGAYICRAICRAACGSEVDLPLSLGKDWSEWQDLNLRPPRPERGALPGCATLRLEGRSYSGALIPSQAQAVFGYRALIEALAEPPVRPRRVSSDGARNPAIGEI